MSHAPQSIPNHAANPRGAPRHWHISIAHVALLLIAGLGTVSTNATAATDDATILAAARQIMADDPTPTFITVDADGAPRARTVEVSAPEADMTLWIATRPNTRKVTQLRGNDRVTLHYAVDAAGSYVSVMGRATLHDDPSTLASKTFQDAASLAAFWPDYPDDYLLIRIAPLWIEVLGAGIDADPANWRPQQVDLGATP